MSDSTFRCGHPRTPANSYGDTRTEGKRQDVRCRLCQTARRKPFARFVAKVRATTNTNAG